VVIETPGRGTIRRVREETSSIFNPSQADLRNASLVLAESETALKLEAYYYGLSTVDSGTL